MRPSAGLQLHSPRPAAASARCPCSRSGSSRGVVSSEMASTATTRCPSRSSPARSLSRTVDPSARCQTVSPVAGSPSLSPRVRPTRLPGAVPSRAASAGWRRRCARPSRRRRRGRPAHPRRRSGKGGRPAGRERRQASVPRRRIPDGSEGDGRGTSRLASCARSRTVESARPGLAVRWKTCLPGRPAARSNVGAAPAVRWRMLRARGRPDRGAGLCAPAWSGSPRTRPAPSLRGSGGRPVPADRPGPARRTRPTAPPPAGRRGVPARAAPGQVRGCRRRPQSGRDPGTGRCAATATGPAAHTRTKVR